MDLHFLTHLFKTKDKTNFPRNGDDQTVSLRNSRYPQFDHQWAAWLKKTHPEIWGLGGNIRGNDAYGLWTKARAGSKTQAVEDWIKEREAWAARHYQNHRGPGVVAQIKWGVIGSRGERYMKGLINKLIDRSTATKKLMKIAEQPELLLKLGPGDREFALQYIDDLLWDSLGIMNMAKAKDLDPLSTRGFITLENLLTNKLQKVTAKDRARALGALNELIGDQNFEKMTARSKKAFARKAMTVIENYGLAVGDVVETPIFDGIQDIYKRTKKAAAAEVGSDIAFGIKDRKAVKMLSRYQGLWIRDHFRDDVTADAQALIVKNLEEFGGGRKELGKILFQQLGEKIGPRSYWETVTSANLSNGRTFSQLQSYDEAGFETFEFFNPADERSSVICLRLNGEVFKISSGLQIFEAQAEAQSPEELKKISPWVRYSVKNDEFSFNHGTKTIKFQRDVKTEFLVKYNLIKPPLHGKCRSRLIPGS